MFLLSYYHTSNLMHSVTMNGCVMDGLAPMEVLRIFIMRSMTRLEAMVT